MPAQAIEVLFRGKRRQQRLRTRIVVGIIERLHWNLQQQFMLLRAGAFRELGRIRAVRRECQRHCRRQLDNGVGGLRGADAQSLDHDRDAGGLGGPGAVGVAAGGIGAERLQAVGDHGDHAVARTFQEAWIDSASDRRRGGLAIGTIAGVGAATGHDHIMPRAAGAIDDGDGLLAGWWICGPDHDAGWFLFWHACGGSGRRRSGGFLTRQRRGIVGHAGHWFAAERIFREQGNAGKGHQKQREDDREQLRHRQRKPETPLSRRTLP